MRIGDLFDTRIEEKIEPVIKVGDISDEHKLAQEIGNYVVTPTIERYLDHFLEHYTDSIYNPTTEIGVWISGYFGSGKSYLAKILALLVENRELDGLAASKRFESRLPSDAPRRESILRSLYRISQCHSQVLAFNINTLADSKTTPLPRLVISQYYQSKGYSSNVLYASVIEAELDKRGKLEELHKTVEAKTNTSWIEIQKNPSFYRKHLYEAVCKVAPQIFSSPEEVDIALKNVEKGELFNVQFFIRTILDDLKTLQRKTGKPCRIVLVLDESGQWIEDDAGRLYQLQALVEEAAKEGNGKIWIAVTTHEDIGSIYQDARALTADMKKIESRFRFKFSLTTENIELVLKDRIFKKKLGGRDEILKIYEEVSGELRGLGELSNPGQKLPSCAKENFVTFYPFFPYQIHLIPEIVKSLRSHGGKGEQLSGSTRTLLAITQDILRAGRRPYLKLGIGEIVSFDELYDNLAGGAEIPPDIRRELSRIEEVVPEATPLTRKVAEVLYLIAEVPYIPRTIDNIARLLVESTSDDLPSLISKIEPEISRLIAAKLVAPIGEEYEFLTGERRNLEEAVRTVEAQLKQQDREKGISNFATIDVLGFSAIPHKNTEFPVNIYFDDTSVIKKGFVEIRVYSSLSALSGLKVADLEERSLQQDESQTIFVLSDRIPGFDKDLNRYIAMQEVVNDWKGDPYKSEEARKLAAERESNDLRKLRNKVRSKIDDGLSHAHLVFHGSSRAITPKTSQTVGETLRSEIATYWPTLYPKYEKVPVRITHDQRAIFNVLTGSKTLSPEVLQLKLFDKAGQLNPQSPLLDTIRIFLTTRQSKQRRTLGKDLIDEFVKPPYGWDPGAIRVGVAAFVRSGTISILINKKPYRNPADPELQTAIRASRNFNRVELILEEIKIKPDELIEVRKLLIKLTGIRKIDETSAALSLSFEELGNELLEKAAKVSLWASPADFPLPKSFTDGKEKFQEILALPNPINRVSEIHTHKETLESGSDLIRSLAAFHEKWGTVYTDMNGFAMNLNGIEHLLPSGGACRSFLNEFRTAKNSARIAALWMKAKEKAPKLKATDLSIFHYHLVATNIQLPKDKGHLETFLNEHPEDQPLRAALDTVLKGLTDAHELGSLLQIEEPVEKELQNLRSNLGTQRTLFDPKTDEDWETWRRGVVERLKKHFVTEAVPSDLAQFFFSRSASKGLVLLDLLSRRYDVVATNPPYMGSRNFGNTIHTYLKDFYADGKNDLYGAFVIRLGYLLKRKGVFAMVTQQSWLFLAQYRPLRRSFLKQRHMELLVHLGPHAFQEISGAKANVIVFVARNETSSAESLAIRLTAFGDPLQKALALRNACRGESALMYHFQQSNFKTLPGLPFAYWMPRKFYEAFSLNAPLGKYFENYNFTKTGNKNRFLRYFWEAPTSPRWIWLTKGGTYCKWIGNEEFEIDWSAGACAHYRNDPIGRITEEKWWYLPGITYTTNASKGFSARHNQGGGVFDYNGPCLSAKGISNDFLLGILNSRTFNFMVRFICGPLAIVIGDIKRVPSPSDGLGNDHKVSQLERLVKQCCKLKDYLTSQELHERRCNPLVFYGMSTEERLELNLAVEAFLASLEGEVEHTVLELYRFSDEDLCEIIGATGTPSSWFPLIQDYDASPLLSELLTEMPEEVFKYVKRPERCVLSRKELADLKGRLRALYVAGYGSKFESFEADNVIVRGEDKKEVEMGARIPISSETFLEELANKLKVHPISVYWLLKEGIEQEHWRCFSKERCMITDLLSMTILRLLGHRWPKQIEAGELVPDWTDPDGIIPLTEGTGEPTLLDRVHGRILEDFEGSDVTAIEHEFADIVGKPLDEWLTTEFFKHHTKQFKKRPIAWQIESRLVTSSRSGQGRRRTSRSFSGPAFSCIVYYHRLDDDLMPKIRSQYVGPLRVRYETELRTLENIKTPSADQTERRVTLEILIEELKEFDARLEEVINNGFDSPLLKEVVAQEPLDRWASIDGEAPPPSTRDLFYIQEKAYDPDLNDGVRVNIAPLQKAGLLASEVLSKKDVDRAIRDRAEWRTDERRWCREGKLPQPGWWKTKGENT